ncbi:MAG: hypothetical protein DRN64_03655 [Thaumarchaeota archaeon]|nr:MAG: hypothetical protein DRN64_03655 [Nitrososphaerota archaeon]
MRAMGRPSRRLRRLGKAFAFAEGRLVVEGELLPSLGDKVYDSGMREVGVVLNVFGPVNRFFIEVEPRKGFRFEKGTPLYIIEEESRGHTKRSRR